LRRWVGDDLAGAEAGEVVGRLDHEIGEPDHFGNRVSRYRRDFLRSLRGQLGFRDESSGCQGDFQS
jgi:hypothetical protein